MEHRKIMQMLPTHNTYKEVDMYNADKMLIDDATHETRSNMSMVVVMQNSPQEKTLDIYCVRYGQYCACVTIG